MKYILGIVIVLFSTSALAFSGEGHTQNGAIHHNNLGGGGGGSASNSVSNATSMSSSISSANSSSTSSATAFGGMATATGGMGFGGNAEGGAGYGGRGGDGGNARGGSANNNGGNVNITSSTKVQRNAPGVGLPAMFPTAVCQGTLAAGFSFLLGGGAGAASITIEECMILETLRVNTALMQSSVTPANALLLQSTNNELLCMTKYGKQTTMCKAMEEKAPKVDEDKLSHYKKDFTSKVEAVEAAPSANKHEKAVMVERSVTWADVTGLFN